MRRSASVLMALLLGVIAACNGGSGSAADVAATVEGTDISVEQVEAMTVSPASGAVPADQFNKNLYNAIVEVVLFNAAKEEFGYDASEAEIEAKKTELTEQIEASNNTIEGALASEGIPLERFDDLAHQHVIDDKLLEHFKGEVEQISDQEADLILRDQMNVVAVVCASHLVVATEAEAEAAKQRIAGGESFKDVAMDVGTDGSAPQGGALGCTAPANFVPEFATATLEAPIGEVYGPFETKFGFHLLVVESRDLPTIEQVKANAAGGRARTAIRDWMTAALAAATVEVNERFGTWVTEPVPQVLPPQS
jgi:parvulin-like peptidyl-prolyl isomerase